MGTIFFILLAPPILLTSQDPSTFRKELCPCQHNLPLPYFPVALIYYVSLENVGTITTRSRMRQYFVNYKQVSNSPFWQNNSGPVTVAVQVIYNVLHQLTDRGGKTPGKKNFLYLFYLV